MSDKFFVDTNILLYAHERSSDSKNVRARQLIQELWQSGNGVLSTQVLHEFCVTLRRNVARAPSQNEIRELVQDYLSWEIVVPPPASILDTLEVQSRFQISFWDALIVQAASRAGCRVIYSEDFQHGQAYGSVSVMNPFVPS